LVSGCCINGVRAYDEVALKTVYKYLLRNEVTDVGDGKILGVMG
jgi:hypothetical protein